MRAQFVFYAVFVAICLFIPPFLPRHILDLLVFSGIYMVAGLGVGLLLGQCGIANLGQSVFYSIGAYATGYVTVLCGYSPALGFLTGICASAALALTVGWPILRLTGYFLALSTLSLGIIANALALEMEWLTGGALGIGGVPKLQIGSFVLDTPLRYWYLVLTAVAVSLFFARNLVSSRTGLLLRALRDSPEAAVSLGISPRWLKTRMFILSAVFGSVAGSLFAHYGGFVNVQSFGTDKTITFLLIPVLGGMSSLFGIVVGALFIVIVPELLSSLGNAHQILFGVALISIVVLFPSGFMGGVEEIRRKIAQRNAEVGS